jgi:hypothetical protein
VVKASFKDVAELIADVTGIDRRLITPSARPTPRRGSWSMGGSAVASNLMAPASGES